MNPQLFFHIHVPKSAGSMFASILKKNFKNRFVHDNPYLSTLKYSKKDIIELIEFYSFECYSGHIFALPNLPFENYHNLTAVSFIRDPISKYISYYFFQRSRIQSSDKCAAKRLMISEYIEWQKSLKIPNQLYTDGSQVDWILGKSNGTVVEIEEFIKKEKYNIFPSERFGDACIVLEKLFSTILTDCSYTKKINESAKDQVIEKEIIEKISGFEWINRDKMLHELSYQHLDKLIGQLFKNEYEFESAKNIFLARTEKRESIREKIILRGKNIVKKVLS